MHDDRKNLGRRGETAATAFVQARGFKILETNYQTKIAEIDIIARDKDCICFIEVKTRRSLKKGCQKNRSPIQNKKKLSWEPLFI